MVLSENKDNPEEKNSTDLTTSKEVAIDIKNLTMEFKITKDKIDTLKEYVIRTIKRNKAEQEKIRVLEDISFTVYKGERIGILGFNGAGKSTLLKIVSGIYEPTEGEIEINGKIAPLLELGAGFDNNYSGKNNIYLNAAFLSMDKNFIDEKYDEIVEFSELGEFINYPVKNYSSGMRAKLGFSIATMINPDILIIDEILAVGDIKFKKKSSEKIKSLMSDGVTVLLVSHSIGQIREICNRCIWIEKGHIIMDGEANQVCDAYEESVNIDNKKPTPWIGLPANETYNQGEYMIISFKKEKDGDPITNEKITFYIDDEQYTRIINEYGKIGIQANGVGEHQYKITFLGNDEFNPKSLTFNRKVIDSIGTRDQSELEPSDNKIEAWIHVDDDEKIIKGDYLIIEAKEESEDGIPITNETIDIYMDDTKIVRPLSKHGRCGLKITKDGTRNFVVEYHGNERINPKRIEFTKNIVEAPKVFAYDETDMDEDKIDVRISVEGDKTMRKGEKINIHFKEKETGKAIESGEATVYINNVEQIKKIAKNGKISIYATKSGANHIKINYHGSEEVNPKTILFTKHVEE